MSETCEKCGASVPEEEACYEMAAVSCPGCFLKQFDSMIECDNNNNPMEVTS